MMNGREQQQQQQQRHPNAQPDRLPRATAAAGLAGGDNPPSGPPSNFFSHSYNNRLPSQQQQRLHRGGMPAYNYMPAVSDLHHNITGAHHNREEEQLMQMRRMRGGDHLGTAAAAALAHRRMILPMAMSMGSGPRLPPRGPIIVGGVGTSKEDGNDDDTAFRTESIEHIIALQEAQARRDHELEQLRQLEFIQAVNQRRIEEEMMLAEQQRHLRSRQMYYPPTHGAAERRGSIGDELLMNRQARLSQLQFMSTNELLARAVGSNNSGDGSSMSQLLGQGGFQRGISNGTGSSGGVMKPPQLADASLAVPVVHNFGHPPQYYKPPSRSNTGGQTTAAAPPPTLRYWNNGVEVDIRGAPLTSSPLNRLNSSTSATSTAATRTSATTSSSSRPDDKMTSNIISQFSTHVMECIPEIKSALSNLLSEVMLVKGFPSDPLIVHSKFPGFVGSALIELKSLGERSKDKKELYERVTKCVSAIEPYEKVAELGEPSSVHAQIRAIVEEGTGRASNLISGDPSERRAKDKEKRKKMEMRRKGSDGKGEDLRLSKKSKRRRRDSSQSNSDTIDILGMYLNHKSKVEEEVEANDSEPAVTSSTKESSGTSIPVKSDDDGTSNVKQVERKKASPKVSNSSPSDTTTQPKEKGASQPTAKKNDSSDPSDANSKHPQAKSKSSVEQGPHSNLLRQIFGKNSGEDSGDSNSTSAKINAVGVATSKQAAADQKRDDNTVKSGHTHTSVANMLLGLGK